MSSKTLLKRLERLERTAQQAPFHSSDECDGPIPLLSMNNSHRGPNDAPLLEEQDSETCAERQPHKRNRHRNMGKRGLYSRCKVDFVMLWESQYEYDQLLEGLRKQYRPVGTAENLEVERIAVCNWRLIRAWRFENSIDRLSCHANGDLESMLKGFESVNKVEQGLVNELHTAKYQLDSTGEIPQELKQRFFEAGPEYGELWQEFERTAQEMLEEMKSTDPTIAAMTAPRQLTTLTALLTVRRAIYVLTELCKTRIPDLMQFMISQYLIPDDASLKRLITYEMNAERSLARALRRLSELQRRRRYKPIFSPL